MPNESKGLAEGRPSGGGSGVELNDEVSVGGVEGSIGRGSAENGVPGCQLTHTLLFEMQEEFQVVSTLTPTTNTPIPSITQQNTFSDNSNTGFYFLKNL